MLKFGVPMLFENPRLGPDMAVISHPVNLLEYSVPCGEGAWEATYSSPPLGFLILLLIIVLLLLRVNHVR